MARSTLRRDRDGIIELAYMFVFIITAFLLTVMTISTTDMVRKENDKLAESQFEQVADSVLDGINEAISVAAAGDYVTYEKTIAIPRQILGLDYTIDIDSGQLVVESTDGSMMEQRRLPVTEFTIKGSENSVNGIIQLSYANGEILLGSPGGGSSH